MRKSHDKMSKGKSPTTLLIHGLTHEKRELLEADGETHRRDCECPRCEAGFTPSERERERAAERVGAKRAAKQGQQAAVRAWERKREARRLAQLDLAAYFRKGNAAADAEVQRLRDLRAKVIADRRLDELLRLRREGMSLAAAVTEVDRRFPASAEGSTGADNDNGHARERGAIEQAGLFATNR